MEHEAVTTGPYSKQHHPISLTLSFHLHVSLSSRLFPSHLKTKPHMHTCLMLPHFIEQAVFLTTNYETPEIHSAEISLQEERNDSKELSTTCEATR